MGDLDVGLVNWIINVFSYCNFVLWFNWKYIKIYGESLVKEKNYKIILWNF